MERLIGTVKVHTLAQKITSGRQLVNFTVASTGWSGTFFNLSGRPGRDPVAAPPVGNLTCNFWVEKNTILEMSL